MDVSNFKIEADKVVDSMVEDFSRIRTGRAAPELIENVKVDAYGTEMTLKSIANINVSDSKSLVAQPWDKTLVNSVSKGLMASNLGLSVSVEGDGVRVTIPDLSQERRLEYVKVMKERSELARIGIRNARQKTMKDIELQQDGGLSEDEAKRRKEEVEKEVKIANDRIAELREVKEKELLTV